MAPTVLWFRRDLRLSDHPALVAAASAARSEGEAIVPLFVLDDALRRPSGAPRLAFLYRCLRDLDASLDGRLVVRAGDPAAVVPALAAEAGAGSVFASADFGPYGRRRDEAVEVALGSAGRRFERVGSPYAVEPGVVSTGGGTPFRVFTPFYRAWKDHGWASPARRPSALRWADGLATDGVPADPEVTAELPPAGEAAAASRLDAFIERSLASYADRRDEPGADATSRLSVYLKYGCLHPRQVLARLGRGRSDERFRTELAWRDFYADVLWHEPQSARRSLQRHMAAMDVDSGPTADARFEAWAAGRTGYPLVDAGMRQLLGQGWVHNRVRMIVASFLMKDLHVDWTRGARWFMSHLVDGDLASNNHGWQWVAGTGTDPAPYFRVFNPVLQSKEHDPDGAYIRRWVPELADLDGSSIHEPWKAGGSLLSGYPPPIVDHQVERREALARYDRVKVGR